MQSAVDDKHDLIVEYDVSLNPSDRNQLNSMVKKGKGTHNEEALYRVGRQRVL